MAEQVTIARPYAEAVFDLAQAGNALGEWSEMLRALSTVSSDERVQQALDNPKLGADEQASLLLGLCGDKLNTGGRSFVRVLSDSGRLGLLPQIREMFEARKDHAEGVSRAEILSAFPLEADQMSRLTSALERRFGGRVETTVTVDPSLIGGARITVGDTVIDGSVQAELQSMANQMRI